MNKTFTLYSKELRIYFSSPIAYAAVTIFLLLTGFYFYNIFGYYSSTSLMSSQNPYAMMGESLDPVEFLSRPLMSFTSIVMLLLMPLLTMRLFSEEKKMDTVELLFTLPVTDLQVTMAKYLSCLTVFALMLGLTALYPVLISVYGTIDPGPVLTGYCGLFLMGAAFIALGLFASSLTENQIISAVIAFGALLLFWMIGWVESYSSSPVAKAAAKLSVLGHFDSFSKGLVYLSDAVYYVLYIVFFIFCTLRVLESNKWRS